MAMSLAHKSLKTGWIAVKYEKPAIMPQHPGHKLEHNSQFIELALGQRTSVSLYPVM